MVENDIGREMLYEVRIPPCEHYPEGYTFGFRFVVERSGAFQYGNRTWAHVFITEEGEPEKAFGTIDTRYEKRSFEEMADSWVLDYVLPESTVLRVIKQGDAR